MRAPWRTERRRARRSADRRAAARGDFWCQLNPRYPDAEEIPDTVLINPVITPLEKMEEDWEGCLSVPGMRGVGRASRRSGIRARRIGQSDRSERGRVPCAVVQHECDHLDGICNPMRMRDMSQFGFVDVLFPDQESGRMRPLSCV